MKNMGIISESKRNSYKKVENMWIYLSDDTGAFPNINNLGRIDIEGATGM